MRSTAVSAPAPERNTLDDLFPDPTGVIAALVADLPAPAPSRAVRVSAVLAATR